MKIFYMMLVATALVANVGFSQERSAGGSKEVQASFSALKTSIDVAMGKADAAWTLADEAAKKAEKMRICSEKGRFLNENDRPSNLDNDRCMKSVSLVDNDDSAMRANDKEMTFDNQDPAISMALQSGMMMELQCTARSNGKVTGRMQRTPGDDGRGQTMYSCEDTGNKDWAINFGVNGGGWKKVFGGTVNGFGPHTSQAFTAEVRACQRVKTFSRSMFISGQTVYSGKIVVTPFGARVLDRSTVIAVPQWNGKMKFDNCEGTMRAIYYNL